jgi:rhodanese-related sulfurtransferase
MRLILHAIKLALQKFATPPCHAGAGGWKILSVHHGRLTPDAPAPAPHGDDSTFNTTGSQMSSATPLQSPTPFQIQPAQGYAGDILPALAWAWLQAGDAVLVDVRSDAERAWVGYVPGAVALAWKQWPDMAINPGFDEGLKAAVPPGKKAVLLCRSGVRSIAAAKRATELGMEAYNILEGFEGDADAQGQRGHLGGWRFRGLPWQQG